MNLGEKRVGFEIKSILCDHKRVSEAQLSAPWLNTETESWGKFYCDIQSTHLTLNHILQVRMTKETESEIMLYRFVVAEIKESFCYNYNIISPL